MVTDSPRLKIGTGLSLDAADFVEQKTAILGMSGSGKSGALKVIEEELIRTGFPFIVFDPAGIAWGLRSSINGKGPGLKVLVVGGQHGDVVLDKTKGAEMAREVVRANAQVIFDFSDESTTSYQRFVADFCEALYAAQGESTTPRLLIIDEAHEIVPQDVRKSEAPSFGAVRKIVTRGRNRGLGVCLVSQRPAGIAKSVLTQCEMLWIFNVLGTPDRKAINDWVSAYGDEKRLDAFEAGLATLRPQECYVWAPRSRLFEKVKVRNFRTLHPDRTHLRRQGLLDVKPVVADIPALIERLSKEIAKVKDEKAEVASVPVLRHQVADLQAKLARRATSAPPTADPEVEARLQQVQRSLHHLRGVTDRLGSRFQGPSPAVETLLGLQRQITTAVQQIRDREAPVAEFVTEFLAIRDSEQKVHRPNVRDSPAQPDVAKLTVVSIRATPVPLVADPDHPATDTYSIDRGGLSRAERSILIELARRPNEAMSRQKVGVLAGYSVRSSSFSNATGGLRSRNYIAYGAGGTVQATPDGVAAAGPLSEVPKTQEGLVREWSLKLPSGAIKMLEAVIRSHPEPMTREALSEASGYSTTSSSFSNYLGLLRTTGLIDYGPDRTVKITEVLYP